MRGKFNSVTARAANFSLALILLYTSAAGATNGRGTEPKVNGAATAVVPVREQSGYWAQVLARDATVRSRPGGPVVARIVYGQWFHVYPSYRGNPAWLLGYMCPRGNRGCGNRESIPGFILRTTLSGPRAAAAGRPLTAVQSPTLFTASDDSSTVMDVRFISVSAHAVAPVYGAAWGQGEARRICSDQVWMRNDRLWPIEILKRHEVFYVERYTDGSKEDGKRRWAIGRARGIRGRVLVSSLCR